MVDTSVREKQLCMLNRIVEKLILRLSIARFKMVNIIQLELADRKITWCTRCHKIVSVGAVEYLLEYDVNEGKGGIITPSYFNRICPDCNVPYNFNWSSQWANVGGDPCRRFYKVKKELDNYYFEKNNEWLSLPNGYLERFYITREMVPKLIEQLFP